MKAHSPKYIDNHLADVFTLTLEKDTNVNENESWANKISSEIACENTTAINNSSPNSPSHNIMKSPKSTNDSKYSPLLTKLMLKSEKVQFKDNNKWTQVQL